MSPYLLFITCAKSAGNPIPCLIFPRLALLRHKIRKNIEHWCIRLHNSKLVLKTNLASKQKEDFHICR